MINIASTILKTAIIYYKNDVSDNKYNKLKG